MITLLETFCLLEGQPLNTPYHARRVALSVGSDAPLEPMLRAIQHQVQLQGSTPGRWRASVTYTPQTIIGVRLIPYSIPAINALCITPIAQNIYPLKLADRSPLDRYKKALPTGTEPLFVLDGRLTDTSFTSILLEREGALYAPTSYLLYSTKRQMLIDAARAIPAPVTLDSLHTYQRIHLVNALLDPGELTLAIPDQLHYAPAS